ncbi:MAG TPA: hypothetical protein VI485_21540 [Vicinamibacterales bacterium]|nr:hypothetical protein [Vicinamibacterales bacterium]
MPKTLADMIVMILRHCGCDKPGRSMTVRELAGALREMFARRVTRREIKLACYLNAAVVKRAGSGAYRLDVDGWVDRFWRGVDDVSA